MTLKNKLQTTPPKIVPTNLIISIIYILKTTIRCKRNSLRYISMLKLEYIEFIEKLIDNVIKIAKKSEALNLDKTTPMHLHNIERNALTYLTKLINLSMRSADLQKIRKIGRVKLLHIPSIPADDAKSFLPIALLPPIA